MKQVFVSDYRKIALTITIKCSGKKRFRVWAEYDKPNSIYADRVIEVENERSIYFSFPITPKNLLISVDNINDINDKDFSFTMTEKNLKTYDVWLDSDTRNFVDLATRFSQVCGYEMPHKQGTIYQTNDAKFNIKYFPVIREQKTGKPLTTPARIGHNSGIIEVSAVKFIKYTFAMRMAILLHEYSHKYKNPKMGLKVSNEFGADINAIYIYLGLGFSKIDLICVFANVFLVAQTDENIKRMRKIQNYIAKFEQGEFAKIN